MGKEVERIRQQLRGQQQESEEVERIRQQLTGQHQKNSELVRHLLSLLSERGSSRDQRKSAERNTLIEVVKETGDEHHEYSFS